MKVREGGLSTLDQAATSTTASKTDFEKALHALQSDDVYDRLTTSPEGLTSAEAKERLKRYGANEVRETAGTPLILKFLANFYHFFALLLWAGAALAFASGTPELGFAIIAVIIINGIFSFYQEYKAEKATEALKRLLPTMQTVMRDGEQQRILASELVPGDVIVLAEGDSISADARLVESFELRANNATLTGESLPVMKSADAVLEDLPISQIPNYVFAGTAVATGTGRGVVFATGMRTEFGKIAGLTQTVQSGQSPLERQLGDVVKKIAIIAISVGVVFFFLGLFVGVPFVQALLFSVGVIVALTPEGLLPTVTLALAVAVQRMAKQQALVKKLSSVQTLGSTTVIITDKTGTLTANQMTVRRIWTTDHELEVSGIGYEPKGELHDGPGPIEWRKDPQLAETLRAATLANNARVLPPDGERPGWSVVGDPTEAALLVAATKAGFDYYEDAVERPRVFELPFDSARKLMSSINRERSHAVAYVKGAPNAVLAHAKSILTAKGVTTLTPETREEVMAENDKLAREGLRVLAMASNDHPGADSRYTTENVEQDLTFLGLMAMQDPPRPEVSKAVETAHRAGIRVVMVTGDYGLTAEFIAWKIGVVSKTGVRIIDGAEMKRISEEELKAAFDGGEVIFARVTPEDKMRVVSALKDKGAIVAVTGDGVNDAPALKRADIGVAMGITGTDVAKEASAMILTNDNFASIVSAVEQGRAVFDNVRKFITFILACNLAELVPFLAFVVFRIPLPLTVLQILAIDLGTNLLPALALGTEKPEPGVMDRPPLGVQEPLLNRGVLLRGYAFLGVLEAIAAMSGYFWVYLTLGWRPGEPLDSSGYTYILATSMTWACIVAAQVGNTFATRTNRVSVFSIGVFSNRLLLYGVASELAIIPILTYVPFLQSIFNTTGLRLIDWLFLLIWPFVLFFADEARKYVVRRREK
jgi:magnesium-transporting ATPase (P-type)